MFKQRKKKQIGALLDGELRYGGAPSLYLADEELKGYHDAVLALRRGVASAAIAPEIADGQFNAFMQGIRDGIETPAPRHYGVWAAASLAAAALVLVFSALAFFTTGSEPVRAAEVESAITELEGVTIHSFDNQQGLPTVWVTMPESDLW